MHVCMHVSMYVYMYEERKQILFGWHGRAVGYYEAVTLGQL